VNVYNDPKLSSEEREQCLQTALTVQVFASIAFLLLGWWKLQSVASLAGASPAEAKLFLPVLASIPVMVGVSGYLDPILIATGRYRNWVQASMASGILGFVSFMVLIWMYGMKGAFLGFLSIPVVTLCCYLVVYRSLQKKSTTGPLFPGLFKFGFSFKMLSSFLRISFVTLLPAALSYFLVLALRGRIVAQNGAAANGLQQVPLAITAYLTPFLTNALWGRLQPMVSATGDSSPARKELGFVVRFTLIATTAFATGMMLFSPFFVRLAYSSQFLPATDLVPVQLIGDFFYFMAFPVSIYFLGVSRLREYLLGWLVYYAGYGLFCWFLIPKMGLLALPIGYVLASVIGAGLAMSWYLYKISFADRRKTLWVFAPCLALVLSQAALTLGHYPVYFRIAVFCVATAGGVSYLFGNTLQQIRGRLSSRHRIRGSVHAQS
jgi:O-antigen/teichoic acid export membrane protein